MVTNDRGWRTFVLIINNNYKYLGTVNFNNIYPVNHDIVKSQTTDWMVPSGTNSPPAEVLDPVIIIKSKISNLEHMTDTSSFKFSL